MNALLNAVICSCIITHLVHCYIIEPGPQVVGTKGEVWPKPQHQATSENYLVLRPHAFEFVVIRENCDIVRQAIDRYYHIIQFSRNFDADGSSKSWKSDENFLGYLNKLRILLEEPCSNTDLPNESMDESYSLNVTETASVLKAQSVWGVLKGLETFSQLLHPMHTALRINATVITDYPRFKHRGLLIDTSRHFIPISKIQKTLDAMAYNKMNVFHWHITDDQSFPYESLKYPTLSLLGAYTKTKTYSNIEVQRIISYAAARGIRVVVEFDTPGHTRSWGIALPQLLTPCYRGSKPSGQYGPIDPTKNFTYSFLSDFFEEITRVFPDRYLHLGGDETGYECWQSNPYITEFMKANNFTSYNKLEEYYIQKLINIVDDLDSKSIVWEEVFTNGVKLPQSTVVHVWKSGWESTMAKVLNAGFSTLLSSCWYLDHLSSGGDWVKYYNCEPYNLTVANEKKESILGGEACMWAEVVNEYNIESRVWPRASATAEKLWSAEDADTWTNAAHRLEEHTCRMNRRGIGAQPPNGPAYCD